MSNTNEHSEQTMIDTKTVWHLLWQKRYVFIVAWVLTAALACIYIIPKPNTYRCNVMLAPEGAGDAEGGLASVASSFGFNIGGMATSDAIYPSLYPEVFESTEFLVSLLNIKVQTYDKSLTTDYYTYITQHQKRNALTAAVSNIFGSKKQAQWKPVADIDPFSLTVPEHNLIEKLKDLIKCTVDKKNDVITISVEDQDRRVCALLADSIKERLQNFIIDYRTKKVRQDVAYYQHLTDSARLEYEKAVGKSGSYDDAHRNAVLQTYLGQSDKLKNDLSQKQTAYNTLSTQLQAVQAKLQERTPSFTTLRSATIPIEPDSPKRLRFIAGMLILVTIIISMWAARSEMKKLFRS